MEEEEEKIRLKQYVSRHSNANCSNISGISWRGTLLCLGLLIKGHESFWYH
jgi:hypothetical protein